MANRTIFVCHLLAGALCAFALGARAAGPVADLAAPDAYAAAKAGRVTLVDIRTPGEWRESGVAQGAKRIDMLDPQFETKLRAALGGSKSAPIALICRTGNRTTHVQRWLREQGYTSVFNIKEGMAGSAAGPGWLARGLPLER